MIRGSLLFGLALVAVAPRAADASCDPPAPVSSFTTWPGLGMTNVPVNAVALVTYTGTSPVLASPGLALRSDGGAEVAATVTELSAPGPGRRIYLLVPDAPLAPSTKYAILDTVKWDCKAEPCGAPLSAMATFTTGSTTSTKLLPAAVPAVGTQTPATCADGSCCGPSHAIVTTLQNPATGAIRYDLYDGGTLIERNTPFVIATDCAQPGDAPYRSPVPAVPLAPGLHHLTLNGFDIANHETIGTQALALDLRCPAVAPPGPGPDPDPVPPPDDGGCSTTGGAGSLGLGLFLAFASLVRRARRRCVAPETRA
jgi:uncharacterized protein (TIGR03382 family)